MKWIAQTRLHTLVALMLLCAFGSSLPAREKARVFVAHSSSWSMTSRSGAGAGRGGLIALGASEGGDRPQTAEIMKTFAQRCPKVIVTNNREKADYVVLLDHEGGKGIVRKDNKVAVFNKDGDMIHGGSTRSLGNAVKDACNAIPENLPERSGP